LYKSLFIFIVVAIFFNGCSHKKLYEPNDKNIHNDKNQLKKIKNKLDKQEVYFYDISKQTSKTNKFKRDKGYNYLSLTDNTMITKNEKSIKLNNKQKLSFDKEIVSVSKRKNLIAIVFIDNSIAIYDIVNNQMIFKEQKKHIFIYNSQAARPIFLNNTVLFPTLDGKIAVVDIKNRRLLRDLIVATTGLLKNITFLQLIDETLVTSTNNNILSFGEAKLNIKEFEIVSTAIDADFIYIATIDGQVIKMTKALDIVAKKKFNFANFLSINVFDHNIFLVEAQGFLIKISDDFKKSSVYHVDIPNDKDIAKLEKKYFVKSSFRVLGNLLLYGAGH